jgi:hypothetical protein
MEFFSDWSDRPALDLYTQAELALDDDEYLYSCVKLIRTHDQYSNDMDTILDQIFTEEYDIDRKIMIVMRYAPLVANLLMPNSSNSYIELFHSITNDPVQIFRANFLWRELTFSDRLSKVYTKAFDELPKKLIKFQINPLFELHLFLLQMFFNIYLKFERWGYRTRETTRFVPKVKPLYIRLKLAAFDPLIISSIMIQCAISWNLNNDPTDYPELLNLLVQLCHHYSQYYRPRKNHFQALVVQFVQLPPVRSILQESEKPFSLASTFFSNAILDYTSTFNADVLLIGHAIVEIANPQLVRLIIDATVVRLLRFTTSQHMQMQMLPHCWTALHHLLLFLQEYKPFVVGILRDCVVKNLSSQEDMNLICTTPRHVLDFFTTENRNLVLKFLRNEAKALISGNLQTQSLQPCSEILDKFFLPLPDILSASLTSRTTLETIVSLTLDPIVAVFHAISLKGTEKPKEFSHCLMTVLNMILSARVFRNCLNDIKSEMIQEVFARRMASRPNFASCLAESAKYLTRDEQISQHLCETEFDQLKVNEDPPTLYEAITQALSRSLYQLELNSLGGLPYLRASKLTKLCCSMLHQRILSRINIHCITELLNLILVLMEDNPVQVPFYCVDLRSNMDAHRFRPEIAELISRFEIRFQDIVHKISSLSLRRSQILCLGDPDAATRLVDSAQAFGQNVSRLRDQISIALKMCYELINEAHGLQNVLNFLESKYLLTPEIDQSLRESLASSDSEAVSLFDVQATCDEVKSYLAVETKTLEDLKRFSSFTLFSDQFGRGADPRRRPTQVARIINDRTTEAVRQLRLMVMSSDMRIDNFSLSAATGVLSGLRVRGRQQKMESEFKEIIKSFTNGDVRIDRATVIERVENAFELLKIRALMNPFETALSTFCQAIPPLTGPIFRELASNFVVSQSSKILSELTETLGGMNYRHLRIISVLGPMDDLSVVRLIQFFQKNVVTFDRILQQAKNRASNNQVAYRTLLKLPAMRALLQPFWDPGMSPQSLSALKSYIEPHLKTRETEGREAVCVTCEELENVIENWTECERFFRESADSMKNIIEEVRQYNKTGMFISALKGHSADDYPGSLSLSYTTTKGFEAILGPDLLSEAIYWAVLNSEARGIEIQSNTDDSRMLEDFVQTVTIALSAHSKRLELEELGHPEIQASISPPCRFAPCQFPDVESVLFQLENLLTSWRLDVKKYCANSPRLCLLSQKSRVHFLLPFHEQLPLEQMEVLLLPYVIQCFPTFLNMRKKLQNALHAVLDNILTGLLLYDSDLQKASELLDALEVELQITDEYDTPQIHYRELFGCSYTEIYTQLLQDTISQCGHLGSSAMVLWGSETLSPGTVQDWLLVAETGLCSPMHVINLNEMLPRTRDVLWRGLQSPTIKSSITLLFSTRDGLDAFTQFTADTTPCSPLDDMTRKAIFSNREFFKEDKILQAEMPRTDGMLIETWVVAGRSGLHDLLMQE